MQERYLGDSHDFLKYALLRHIRKTTGLRLGINWYLTSPEQVDRPGNNDGEKRHHLRGGVWEEADPELFARIHSFDAPANRTLANVADLGILPRDTYYYDNPVSALDRHGWHAAGLDALGQSDLVFLDPDNGFEVKSMTTRTQPKYALYDEAASYHATGKAVIAIQFARQCHPVQRAADVRQKLVALCGQSANLPVLRGRVAPNLLFFAIAPAEMTPSIDGALRGFAEKCGKVDLIP
jgi:hypothetical protein